MGLDKKTAVHYLRKLRLLQFADSLMLLRNVRRHKESNRAFLAAHPDFVPPPAHLAFDAYNHTNWHSYREMGVIHARLIADLMRAHLRTDSIDVCEWGCGPARVIRHLRGIEGFADVRLTGTDLNRESIAWCAAHIDGIRFLENALLPPLPADPESFDCVYAISIFTHLAEQSHYAWMDELFRVLKPGGILIFSTHGDLCAKNLRPAERERYDAGAPVIRGEVTEGKKHFVAYHPRAFVRDRLLRERIVLQHLDDTRPYFLEQDVWVARKA